MDLLSNMIIEKMRNNFDIYIVKTIDTTNDNQNVKGIFISYDSYNKGLTEIKKKLLRSTYYGPLIIKVYKIPSNTTSKHCLITDDCFCILNQSFCL
jgi:hypothetical protein